MEYLKKLEQPRTRYERRNHSTLDPKAQAFSAYEGGEASINQDASKKSEKDALKDSVYKIESVQSDQ